LQAWPDSIDSEPEDGNKTQRNEDEHGRPVWGISAFDCEIETKSDQSWRKSHEEQADDTEPPREVALTGRVITAKPLIEEIEEAEEGSSNAE
jgi:hypothetical protein